MAYSARTGLHNQNERQRMIDKSKRRYQHLFDTEHIKNDLKNKSLQSAFNSLAGESITFFLRIGSTAILARLLMPEQFGLIGMVFAITGFITLFTDLGLSDATIQNKEISHEQISALFWINVGVGAIFMVLVAGVSPLISWFYGDDRLTGISILLSSCFLLSGLTVQHQALLNRQMRFFKLALIRVISILISSFIGIYLAWRGFEYWALVWKEVATVFFIALGTWLMCRWWPGLPKRGVGVGPMLRFGRNITGFNIVDYFAISMDAILLGRYWGPGPLGLYTKASQLMTLPMKQIRFPLTRVAVPALSSLQQDPDKYKKYFSKLISILSFAYMPLVTYIGFFSENFILLILGSNWIEAAPIFRVLALTAFIRPVVTTCDVVLVSLGKTRRYFRWGLINAVCLISAFSIGVHWGPLGIAAAYAIATYTNLWPSLWYRLRGTPVTISQFLKSISLPVSSSALTGLLLVPISRIISPLTNLEQIVVSFFSTLIVYLGIWWFLPGGKRKLIEYLGYAFAAFKSVSFIRE